MFKPIFPILTAIAVSQTQAQGAPSDYFEPPMASIPAGSFKAKDHSRDESYIVNIEPFQMAKYELTVAEFRKFVDATGYKAPTNCLHEIGARWFGSGEKDGSWDNNFFNLSEFHPVVCIGIQGAEDYAAWLSKKTNKHYRLMSESQWLYVVKTGGYDDYISEQGKKRHQVCEIANLADRHAKAMTEKIYDAPYTAVYGIEDCNDREILSSTVGLYKPDKYGVHDLIGNIQEVVADCYIDGKQRFPQGGKPVVQENCEARIAKGSSWHWEVPNVDSRSELPNDFIAAIEGFRLVLDTKGIAKPAEVGSQEFVAKLTKAQQQAKLVHAQIADYPSKVEELRIAENGNAITLSWLHSDAAEGTSYKVVRQDLITNEEQVIARGIVATQYIDQNPIINKARYKVLAHLGEREGLTSNTVDSNVVVTHRLPTRIQAEAFSQGDNVAVQKSVSEPAGDLVIANLRNTSADYQIDVSKAGKYTLEPRVYHRGNQQSFSVLLDNKILKEFTLTGDNGWQTAPAMPVTLPQGRHTLTIKPSNEGARLSINWLDVKKL